MKSGFCVLWGRPNVGKSTLLNALLGRKHVIVSPRPQTTRHRIAGVLNGENEAFQIVFLDTPGIHQPLHKLGETLVKTAKSSLLDIECVVFVADASDKPHRDDKLAIEALNNVKVPVILALNKRDAVDDARAWQSHGDAFKALRNFDGIYEISAERGDHLPELRDAIVEKLPEGEPYFPPDMQGDRSPSFHIAELVREQAMLQLREEIPHSIAVGIEQMEPRPDGTLYVMAYIFIERESQKRIVVGAGGARIKEIGQAARREIEGWMNRKIYLELRVKVRDKWRDSDLWIGRLGYKDN